MRHCKCGCGERVKNKGRQYALGHNPNSHHPPRNEMTPERRKKIANSIKALWKDKSYRRRQCKQRGRVAQKYWDSLSDEERKEHGNKISKGVRKFCRHNRELVLERARDPERCANISKTSRYQYAHGRKPAHTDSNRYKRGWYYSPVNKEWLYYRSGFELKFMKMLDKSDKVKEWVGEGCAWLPYTYKGKKHTYFIDFFVSLNDEFDQCMLIELKPAYKLDDPVVQAKINAARCSPVLGHLYKVVTNIKEFKRMYL